MQMPFGFEWIFIIVIIVVLFFGVKKIPELAKSFGKATAEFEKAKIEAKRDLDKYKQENIDIFLIIIFNNIKNLSRINHY